MGYTSRERGAVAGGAARVDARASRQISRRPGAACNLIEQLKAVELSAHHLAQAAIPCAPSSLPRGLLRATNSRDRDVSRKGGSGRLVPPVRRLDAMAPALCTPPVSLTVVLIHGAMGAELLGLGKRNCERRDTIRGRYSQSHVPPTFHTEKLCVPVKSTDQNSEVRTMYGFR